MTCSYCGTRNGDGEHRCTRCGRKPEDTLIGGFAMPAVNGALATQLQPVPRMRVVERAQPGASAGARRTSRRRCRHRCSKRPVQRDCHAAARRNQTAGSRRRSGQAALAEARRETREARTGRSGHAGFPAAGSGQTAPVGHHGGSRDLLRSAGRHDAPPRGGIGARLEHGDCSATDSSCWGSTCWAASSISPRAT